MQSKRLKDIQTQARKGSAQEAKREVWPVILLKTPKGWTGLRNLK